MVSFMARSQTVETQKVAMTSTTQAATFEGGVQGVYLSSDADCFVDFDQPSDTGSYLIKANVAYPFFDFRSGSVSKVYAQTATTGNLYILGVRN
jgi:hypothetical protein